MTCGIIPFNNENTYHNGVEKKIREKPKVTISNHHVIQSKMVRLVL